MISYIEKSIACGGSLAGKTHRNMPKNNQDCFLIKKSSIGTLLCVCDGVGSNQFSAFGSRAACKAVLKVFKLYYRKRITKELVGATIEHYYQHYVRKKYRTAAGTTCLFCFIYEDAEVLIGQAGDGMILIRLDDKLFTFLDHEKSFVNEVYPLNCNYSYKAWKIKNLRFIPEQHKQLDILLATDGVSDDVIPDKREDFLNHIIATAQRCGNAGVKDILKTWDAPGSIDDKTVTIFSWRRGNELFSKG